MRARDLGADLARLPVAEALRANEVSWALVYRDDPDAGSLDLTGLELVHDDADLALYAVPGSPATAHHASGATRAVVVGADLLAAGAGGRRDGPRDAASPECAPTARRAATVTPGSGRAR